MLYLEGVQLGPEATFLVATAYLLLPLAAITLLLLRRATCISDGVRAHPSHNIGAGQTKLDADQEAARMPNRSRAESASHT